MVIDARSSFFFSPLPTIEFLFRCKDKAGSLFRLKSGSGFVSTGSDTGARCGIGGKGTGPSSQRRSTRQQCNSIVANKCEKRPIHSRPLEKQFGVQETVWLTNMAHDDADPIHLLYLTAMSIGASRCCLSLVSLDGSTKLASCRAFLVAQHHSLRYALYAESWLDHLRESESAKKTRK